MKTQNLNGKWQYRIGKGEKTDITVPFCKLAVGHSECFKKFDLTEEKSSNVILKFDGITYYVKVYLNGTFLGEMGPYCEYSFDVTVFLKEKDNEITVELEDISPKFGPGDGWENYGGIIRDVNLLYYGENRITDVFFHTKLTNGYKDGEITVETTSFTEKGVFEVELYFGNEKVFSYTQNSGEKALTKKLENVKLWSPDSTDLYELRVKLYENNSVIDTYSCNVGFREFSCEKHRFLLNGKPILIKGVCKHEMIGESGHCPNEKDVIKDMEMIKATGCNFVRLVHYPHNKKTLDIADKLGLMVCEEPGLWWSDTSDPEVSGGSLEVLKRTILRDRNHPSIVFWLCFNECKFTEKYLLDCVKTCRTYDPTRIVSGANCMSLEDTVKYYNMCGFDFYTMHPYSQTVEFAKKSAEVLNDKPLLFTEWGGHFVYDNPKLLKEFIEEMNKLYLSNSADGALAGAVFWEWAEVNDYNRGTPACCDGVLKEGLVDKYRNPNLIYSAFCEALKEIKQPKTNDFWVEFTDKKTESENKVNFGENENKLKEFIKSINKAEEERKAARWRQLKRGPVLENVQGLSEIPIILQDNESVSFDCDFETDKITLFGLTSLLKGYPLSGDYGENVATVTIEFKNKEEKNVLLQNGTEITTVFETRGSSRINPVAQNSKKVASFGYDKNFERYVLNSFEIPLYKNKKVRRIKISSENNGYALLLYGIC